MLAALLLLFMQIGALLSIPIILVRVVKLRHLLRTGQFMYRPLRGERVPTTRVERPGWYWWGIISSIASIAASLCFIGLVAFLTFHPR